MTVYFPFIHPDFCERKPVRTTHRSFLGQQIVSTRKAWEVYHRITYTFEKLSSRQYRIIDNHFRDMDGGVTSFYVIDWGSPFLVKGISGDRITLNHVLGLSTKIDDGGNRIVLWSNSGDYGNDSDASGSVLSDSGKSWSTNQWQDHQIMDSVGTEFDINSNTANAVSVVTGAPMPGAYDIYQYVDRTISSITVVDREISLNASPVMSYSAWDQFLLPVYECHFAADTLEGLEQTGEFNLEADDNYGPYWAGDIEFIQKGTGT